MRIGLNILYLVPGEVGGSEIYARELIPALAKERPEWEFVVYCAQEAGPSLAQLELPTNVELSVQNVRARSKPGRVAHEIFKLPRVAKRDRIDLLHSLGQTTPLWGGGRRVVSVLDLIFHHYPETFPGPARLGLELLVPLGAHRAHRVTTISRATKDDLVATYRVNAEKVDPVLLGAGFTEPETVAARDELDSRFDLSPGEFALCVASGHAHKNVARLLDVFATLPGRNLVLVGHAGLDQDELIARAGELGLGRRVTFTGWVETAELEGLYREATMFVYPTLLEGFGLPVLEAMHRGVPVACSNTSSLPEVAGDAALSFDPLDNAAIAAAVESLMGDDELRTKLIDRGHAQAARFSWKDCARETIDCYERALSGERR